MSFYAEAIDRYLSGEGADRFSLPAIHKFLSECEQWHESMEPLLASNLDGPITISLQRGLIRWAFLAQVVEEPAINTTRYRSRWSERLRDDPRSASPELSEDFFHKSIEILSEALTSPNTREILTALISKPLIPAELPLDYISKEMKPIHVPSNIKLIDLELLERTSKLRSLFKTSAPEVGNVMQKVYAKVQVKSYLTDRVLTGAHKTNREYRWEVSPDSVHFAFKRDCMQIESSLVIAVINMHGFPVSIREQLAADAGIELPSARTTCPITLDVLSYEKLSDELLNPNHGRSSFQVGHLDPLKNDGTHIANNVSWVSDEGNRIQGDNTLDQTREMLLRILNAYQKANLL